jgi:hypothetical protein
MKFILILVITAIVMVGTVNAQHVNIGIKGGLNSYKIQYDNNTETNPKSGFHIGLLGHIHLTNQFGLQPEIVYSTQGGNYKSGSSVTVANLDYINVPVLLQYMFDNGFRLQAGPQLGFLVGAKSNTNNNLKDNLKPIEIGVSVGAGYIHVPSSFGVDARYNIGINSINESGSENPTNRGFQLGVFYLFNHN